MVHRLEAGHDEAFGGFSDEGAAKAASDLLLVAGIRATYTVLPFEGWCVIVPGGDGDAAARLLGA